MDKSKCNYLLHEVKALIEREETISPNISVIKDANKIGFSINEAYQEILNLEPKDFYKSTTEIFNHAVWLDIYKKQIKDIDIYIKFKIVKKTNKFLLSSFKRDTQAE